MSLPRPLAEGTPSLPTRGYGRLPDRMRRAPEAARFAHDERNVRRHGALPEPVRSPLFGHGGAHPPRRGAPRAQGDVPAPADLARGIGDLVGRATGAWDAAGHRCPGEDVTIALLRALSVRPARLEYEIPEQDLRIPPRRAATRPRSGFAVTDVRAHGG